MRLETELYTRLTLLAALREYPKAFDNLVESNLHFEAGRLANSLGVMTSIYSSHLWNALEAEEESGLRICAAMAANKDILYEKLNKNPHQQAGWGIALLAAKDFLKEQDFAQVSLPNSPLELLRPSDISRLIGNTLGQKKKKNEYYMLTNANEFDNLAHAFWMMAAKEHIKAGNHEGATMSLAACLLISIDSHRYIDKKFANSCTAHIEEVGRTLLLPQMLPFLFEKKD